MNSFKRKSISTSSKVIVASTLGVALLIGGGTYALWSATDTANTGAMISSGDLKVTAAAPQSWYDVSDSANPAVITNLADFRLSPGDKIKLTQELNVIIVGDNMTGILTAKLPNSTASQALMDQAKFTLSLFDKDGTQIATVAPTTNTADSLTTQVSGLPQTTAAGEKYTVEITVELPSGADNDTKIQTFALDNLIINLDQGERAVAPIPPTVLTVANIIPAGDSWEGWKESFFRFYQATPAQNTSWLDLVSAEGYPFTNGYTRIDPLRVDSFDANGNVIRSVANGDVYLETAANPGTGTVDMIGLVIREDLGVYNPNIVRSVAYFSGNRVINLSYDSSVWN